MLLRRLSMHPRTLIISAVVAMFLSALIGCTTSDGSSGGWVVVGQPKSSPPPPQKQPPPPKYKKGNRGQDRAARNHIRSAYRFLQKNKPDHAMRELEKARNKMGKSFWFHYYMGGAYYYKGMYELAGDSWKMAYRYTKDYRLRSRLRTCQSFAIHYLKGDEPSIGFLNMAIDIDRDNRHARELLEDLVGSGGAPSDSSRTGVQVGFMRPSGRDGGNREEELRELEDDDDKSFGRSKTKKGREKDDRKHGKPGKKKEKPEKIRDKERFKAYFLIEME
jgi:tetratricopeptide (TPR) repeat protein